MKPLGVAIFTATRVLAQQRLVDSLPFACGFAHFIDLTFLPSVICGILLGIVWRYVDSGRVRFVLQLIGSLLFFIPQPLALYLGGYTFRLRLYQQVLLSLWGFGTGVLMTMKLFSRFPQARASRRSTERKAPNKLLMMLGIVAMLGLGVYCAWTVIGDYLLQHERVAGTVEGARVVRHRRSPNAYQLMIDHRAYGITRDLLAQVNRGDYVEAEIGIASKTILQFRYRNSSAPWNPELPKIPSVESAPRDDQDALPHE